MTDHAPGFEIEVKNLEEFLELLEERRHSGRAGRGGQDAAGGVVFVARIVDRCASRYAFPMVVRRVIAAFAHGQDRVSCTRTVSGAVEFPETMAAMEDRHREAYEQVLAEIELGLRKRDLGVPVRRGSLRISDTPG